MDPLRRPALRALLAVSALGLTAAGTGAVAAATPAPDPVTPARTVPHALVQDRDVDDRLAQPEDRYAVAGGCYTLEAPGQGYVTRAGADLALSPDAAAAVPLHFQATRLGEYLLATNEGRDTAHEGAWWDVRNYVAAGALGGAAIGLSQAPSEDAEWRLVAAAEDPDARTKGNGTQRYVLSVPSRDQALAAQGGDVVLVDGAAGTPLVVRHVPDDDPSDTDRNGTACATWPEIETGASGKPQPVKGSPAQRVQGFFEAHVHGMAFEFLGGELRCGRPWHEYGVEHALGNCFAEKNLLNGVLEVPLGGQDPAYALEYDPQGWPTFASWPRNRTLTHEQFYWRWLERAHAGGLRLMTNLLVENTALCAVYPVKRNSCNEMDGVRLQAQRLFELQDYVDAQNGGPGEGWFRIVTSPAQARETINAGRLAVVLGIENSELFDCREVLDQPQCTPEQIDERLQEVVDMGVRQLQIVNKFDNALTGVTGDNGVTGIIVNAGNKLITQHFWDMRSCEEDGHSHEHGVPGDEHDRTQPSPLEPAPEGVDALAGRVLDQFGGLTSTALPVYGPGPHCNERGLTPLGEHVIRAAIDKGLIFDPDHMSARAQREAMDLIEKQIVPQEREQAAAEGRAPVQPSVISSHSWANDVVYQRIYRLDGVVAPRTQDAGAFVDSWAQHRDFAARNAPEGYDFGLGYGADTNGLGGQPGPRAEAATRVDYSRPFAAPIGGVTLSQQRSGLRTFDVNTEGVSHYGLFADWFHELTLAADERQPALGGGDAILADMLDGAETYLQMWERLVYGGNDCVNDLSTFQLEDLNALLGLNVEGFLKAIGSPVSREGDAYVYCVQGEGGEPEQVEVVFGDDGSAEEVRDRETLTGAAPSSAAPSDVQGRAAADGPGAAPGALPRGGVDEPHRHTGDEPAGHHDTAGPGRALASPAGASSFGTPAGVAIGLLAVLAAALLAANTVVGRRREQSRS